jgi:hypothetical protein
MFTECSLMFSIEVVADFFEGKNSVQRQRAVYKAIWEELQVSRLVTNTSRSLGMTQHRRYKDVTLAGHDTAPASHKDVTLAGHDTAQAVQICHTHVDYLILMQNTGS